jgi:hypothetical protein
VEVVLTLAHLDARAADVTRLWDNVQEQRADKGGQPRLPPLKPSPPQPHEDPIPARGRHTCACCGKISATGSRRYRLRPCTSISCIWTPGDPRPSPALRLLIPVLVSEP